MKRLVLAALAAGLLGGCAAPAPATTWQAPAPSPGSSAPVDPVVPGAPPTRVRIPAIGVDSPLEPLHLDAHGALSTPSYPHAGWYADGPAPGDVGPAVIAGHVDSTSGPAVFYRLGDLRSGDTVLVLRSGRWLTFRVVDMRRYPKDAFPTVEVYGPTPDAQLRLITCGGDFDRARRSYLDNTVVYAVET